MAQQEQSRWRPTRRQLLWAGAAAALMAVAVLIGYRYDITVWDWLKLLVVPAVIAGGGIWFNRQQRERELEIAREQRDRETENRRSACARRSVASVPRSDEHAPTRKEPTQLRGR